MDIIPFDQREGLIWYNGEFVEWKDAKVHILNHGLHYASSVFEGERVYNGKIFKLSEHSARLKESARSLDFEIDYTIEELDNIAKETVEKQGINNGYMRRIAWRGSEKMAISAQNNRIHLAAALWEWPQYYADRKKGIRLTFTNWKKASPDTAPVQHKCSGLYMTSTISKHNAEKAGFHDAIMLDYRGYIAETTSSNLFFVKDKKLFTPIPDCFLNGITRRVVIELAQARNIEVTEKHVEKEELLNADEVFVTGTAAEVTPVSCIDDINFALGEGTITNDLVNDYFELVNK